MPKKLDQFPADELMFFALLQELMHTHPNRKLVDQVHSLALSSPGIRRAYVAGAWKGFDLQLYKTKK